MSLNNKTQRKMIFQKPIVFFDLETTGTDIKNDRIVEISMGKFYPDSEHREEVKTRLVNPTIPIPKQASEIHNIWDVDVQDAPTFKQIAKGVLQFIKGCDIAGYNILKFDVPLLFVEFNRAGIEWDYKEHNFLDACVIFKRMEERTLSAAVKFYLGKTFEEAHSAEADVQATVDVFRAQLEKYEDSLPDTMEELSLFCNYDKKSLDLSGFFGFDKDGNIIFNTGKHKDKIAKDHPDYLEWVIKPSSGFLPDTVNIAKSLLHPSFL